MARQRQAQRRRPAPRGPGGRSAQPYQGADGQVGTQDHGDAGHELQGVTQQPVLGTLEQRLGGLGPELQERERDYDQLELDDDEDNNGDDLRHGRVFAGD